MPPARKMLEKWVNTRAERKKEGRKIKKSFIRKIKHIKMIVNPDIIKVSLIDVFKQGLIQCPQHKRSFLVNSVPCQPNLDLTKKLTGKSLPKEKLPAKKQLVSSIPVKKHPLKKVPVKNKSLKKVPMIKQPLKKQPLVIKLDVKKLAAKKLKKHLMKKCEL